MRTRPGRYVDPKHPSLRHTITLDGRDGYSARQERTAFIKENCLRGNWNATSMLPYFRFNHRANVLAFSFEDEMDAMIFKLRFGDSVTETST